MRILTTHNDEMYDFHSSAEEVSYHKKNLTHVTHKQTEVIMLPYLQNLYNPLIPTMNGSNKIDDENYFWQSKTC